MKRLWISIVVGALAILTCTFCLIYIDIISNESEQKLIEIRQIAEEKNYEKALKKTEELEKFIEQNHGMLAVMIHHEILEEMRESTGLMQTALNLDETEEFWFESTRLLVKISNLRDLETPNIDNIL